MKTITFEAKPIETAPKDRYIYLYARGAWRVGVSNFGKADPELPPCWLIAPITGSWWKCMEQPTHWADIPGPGEEE